MKSLYFIVYMILYPLTIQPALKPIPIPVTIPIVYHFMYDIDRYNMNHLQFDLYSLELAHNDLNDEFEDRFSFQKRDTIITHQSTETLVSMYADYLHGDKSKVINIANTFSIKGYLNVYVLRTFDMYGVKLVGFTTTNPEPLIFKQTSPLYDNIFICFDALFDYDAGNTIAHEIGHWLGLKHPWPTEMTYMELQEMGLTSSLEICINNMNYNCYTEKFTVQQLDFMEKYLKKYRNYLVN